MNMHMEMKTVVRSLCKKNFTESFQEQTGLCELWFQPQVFLTFPQDFEGGY